jgi:hypothetical protein
MINSGENFSNSSRVGDHTDGSHDFSEITSWDDSGWLIVDSAFESSWAPVNELDGSLGLDGSNGGVNILGDNISSVHEATSHILSVSGITFSHHGGWLESRVSDFSD